MYIRHAYCGELTSERAFAVHTLELELGCDGPTRSVFTTARDRLGLGLPQLYGRRRQRSSRWLESCDLRVGQAEAEFLRNQPGGGSIGFTVTLTDRDVRGGDESISSLEVVVTPGSLAERESSVLWHRLFAQVGGTVVSASPHLAHRSI